MMYCIMIILVDILKYNCLKIGCKGFKFLKKFNFYLQNQNKFETTESKQVTEVVFKKQQFNPHFF